MFLSNENDLHSIEEDEQSKLLDLDKLNENRRCPLDIFGRVRRVGNTVEGGGMMHYKIAVFG